MKSMILTLGLSAFILTSYGQLWKQYADSAKAMSDKRRYDTAVILYSNALEELKKDSAETATYARICNALANIYTDNLANYNLAEQLYIKARETRAKAFGKESADYATGCNNLGRLYRIMGQYEKAEQFVLEAKQVRAKHPGEESADYAASCNTLGGLYRLMGRYPEAEPLYIEARKTYEKVLGKESREYASACHNLANLYADLGKYPQAEARYLEAKQIREKLGKDNREYVASCASLGSMYLETGQFEKSESYYLEALQINRKVFGENRDYASILLNLALLYVHIGQYGKAEPLYIESKQVFENLLGKEHPDYATACNNLADYYRQTGEYSKAEPLFIEAKTIWEKSLGKESPLNAQVCNNLANLYTGSQQYKKAEPLYAEAIEVRKKALSSEHPLYAASCNDFSEYLLRIGECKKAESFSLEALSIRKKTFGKEHPDYIVSCIQLGNLYWNMNEITTADKFYTEAINAQNIYRKQVFQFMSETEKQEYVNKVNYYNNFLSFGATASSAHGFAYSVSLSNRNLILSSSQQLHQSIYNIADTNIQAKYNQWIDDREQLAFWYSKPISERPNYVKDLEEQSNTLEKELTKISSSFKSQQSKNNITWQTIQQNLEPNEAAIEFVDFNFYNGKRYTDSTYYVALVLRKDKPEPQLIKLFEKKQLDSLLSSADNINTIYTENNSLYELTWRPLEKYLNGITKIYFAPAGDLFKISFAALPVNDKQLLSDKYQLVQLNTTASVADKNENFISSPDKIQLYGGIEYNADTTQLKAVAVAYHSANEISRSLPDDLERSGTIQFLPGTQTEVEEIQQQAGKVNTQVALLSGINATEESFKALNGTASPSVLHIATHGFFFPDPKETDSIRRKFETTAKVFKQSDNPLLRSVLLFAGANNAWQGKPVSGIEDGIVTAYDVSNMYLPNTKLVVLSACETALGDIEGSEGVYGLQRAFKIAGAQNLVMSLWEVPDAETAEFMQLFYQNMFDHESISEAFYHVQTTMKNKYRNEPLKWAAWVLVR